jgi:hypothetical protein
LCLSAKSKTNDFKAQGISNTLNALSKFDHYDKGLIDALCLSAKSKTSDFNAQGISNTLNALSNFIHCDEILIDSLCLNAAIRIKDFNQQHISNTLHALATLQHGDDEIWCLLFDALSNLEPDSLSLESKSQLHLVLLALSLENSNLLSKLRYSSTLREICAWAYKGCAKLAKSSNLHLDISQTLSQIGVEHRNEFLASGDLSVDIFIKPDSSRDQKHLKGVVIEVDGPSHYCRSAITGDKADARSKRVRGAFVMKEALLQRLGYKVLHVPYFEWGALSSAETKNDYLRTLLK